MDRFANLKRVAIEELEKLDAAYSSKSEFTEKDAETYEHLMHGLKCQLTSEAMMEANEYERGMSGARGHNMNPVWGDGMNGYYPRMPYPPDKYRY